MVNKSHFAKRFLGTLIVALILVSCNQPRQIGITPTNDGSETVATEIFAQATETQETITLTATSAPPAMTVNGLNYPLDDFKQDLLRLQMAFPDMLPKTAFEMLSNDIAEQLLLQQAAIDNGFSVTLEELEQRTTSLVAEIGGEEAFNTWLNTNFYSELQFQATLEREMAIAFQKQIILGTIPSEIEQVELYQILVYDEGTAKSIGQALTEGSDFFWLAKQYHPATLGYIGWNPYGAMLPTEVEDTVSEMEVNTYSEIIQTDYGYHILYLNSREIHSLSPENLIFLQETALSTWMENQKQTATIEIFATYNQ